MQKTKNLEDCEIWPIPPIVMFFINVAMLPMVNYLLSLHNFTMAISMGGIGQNLQ